MSDRPRRRLLVDTAPLRLDRDYRWLWTGQAINGIGTQITRIALPYQVYVLTGSTLAVAALTLVQLIPILIFALGAGSIADAVDRRKLLLLTQLGLLTCSLFLVALSLMPAPPLIGLFAVAFAAAGLSAVDQPARASSIPRLVPAVRLPSAIALNQVNFQVGSIVGPAIGGALIATVGLPGAYIVDALSFTASIIGVAGDRAAAAARRRDPARPRGDPRGPPVRDRPPGDPLDVRHRPERDGVRHADVALPGTRPRRLQGRAERARAHGRGPGVWSVPRGGAVGLGLVGPSRRTGRDRRRHRLGRRDCPVRAVDVLVRPGARLPRDRRRGGRALGGLPFDDRAARDARRPPRTRDLDPHPRRDERPARRRHRGGDRRRADRAAAVRDHGRPAVRGGRGVRGAAVPGARGARLTIDARVDARPWLSRRLRAGRASRTRSRTAARPGS